MGQRRGKVGREPQGVSGVYVIVAVGLLVLAVSIPRLREHVVQGNTVEAPQSLLLVGEAAYSKGSSDLFALLRDEESLRHRLRDARRTVAGGRLSHHGYLIDEVQLAGGQRAFGAWPLDFGRTGRDAWVVTRDGRAYRHPNAGAWSGESRPLSFVDFDEGWVPADPR